MRKRLLGIGLTVVAMVVMLAGSAGAAPPLATSFPADFAVPVDSSLGSPVIGFGASGPVARTPSSSCTENVTVTGQGAFDPVLGTAHLGILNSPAIWTLVADFLTRTKPGPNNGSG